MIEIDVEGRPAPKGSRIAGITKTGHTYTRAASKYEKPWVDAVKTATQIAMRHHRSLDPPYEVELFFRLQPPKQPTPRTKPWPVTPDLDKLVRAVLDGLQQGGCLADDRHVTALTTGKRYVRQGEAPGVHATITNPAASAQRAA